MGLDTCSLGEFSSNTTSMDAHLSSLWSYHQTRENLKQKLFTTTLELETLKSNAKEEIRKSDQTLRQLLAMLKLVSDERDEAVQQLQLLLSFIHPNSPEIFRQPAAGGGGNSSITATSDNLSADTLNSPEFSSCNMNMIGIPLLQPKNYSEGSKVNTSNTSTLLIYDRASAIIDSMAMNKTLPEKGKLLQAVQEAGPLLQNLLLAGPLPQWRTPPPPSTLLKPLFVPPLIMSSPVKAPPAARATLMHNQSYLDPLTVNFSGPSTSTGLIAAKRSTDSTYFDQNPAKHQRF